MSDNCPLRSPVEICHIGTFGAEACRYIPGPIPHGASLLHRNVGAGLLVRAGLPVRGEQVAWNDSGLRPIFPSRKARKGNEVRWILSIPDTEKSRIVDERSGWTPDAGPTLTTRQGHPCLQTVRESVKYVGERGPATLENYQFIEKITHFDRERIPERVVHARGAGAHGYFEAYGKIGDEPARKYTRAKLFQERASRPRCSSASPP